MILSTLIGFIFSLLGAINFTAGDKESYMFNYSIGMFFIGVSLICVEIRKLKA